MKERIKNFVKKMDEEPDCYLLVTDKGISTYGRGNEILSLIAIMCENLKNNLPKDAVIDAVNIGYDSLPDEDSLEKSLDNLEDIIKKIRELINE